MIRHAGSDDSRVEVDVHADVTHVHADDNGLADSDSHVDANPCQEQ